MEEKLSGIVLGGVPFSENDKILTIFTLEKGVVSAKIKGVKKAGAKLKFASEPFCFAEFIISKKGAFNTVIGASLIDSFYPLREDIIKYFCGGAILEFVKRFYREDIVSAETFLSLVNTLKDIAYKDENPKIFLIRFLLTALETAGYALTENRCFGCYGEIKGRVFFDYRRGAFFCEKCFDGVGREINYLTYQTIKDIKEGVQNLSKDGIEKALRLLEYYIENRAEEKINSLKELVKMQT